jgi:hypothetical protein
MLGLGAKHGNLTSITQVPLCSWVSLTRKFSIICSSFMPCAIQEGHYQPSALIPELSSLPETGIDSTWCERHASMTRVKDLRIVKSYSYAACIVSMALLCSKNLASSLDERSFRSERQTSPNGASHSRIYDSLLLCRVPVEGPTDCVLHHRPMLVVQFSIPPSSL